MLKLRQMIPPLTARAADGRTIRAWDYKQKRSLLIAYLHSECTRCDEFLARLCARASDLNELEATALVILSATPPVSLAPGAPREVVVATDMSGNSQRAFLGKDAFGPAGQARVGVFVADRYGELFAQWEGPSEDALPATGDALSWLGQIQIACEECGAPHWPTD